MHDVLRERLIRRIESLPEEQVYQVLDYIEFLESKYAERHLQAEATGLQRFAESLEDRIRKKAMNPATLREAFQLISAADKVLSSVSTAGRQILGDLGTIADAAGEGPGTEVPPGRDERSLDPASRSGRRGPGPARGHGDAGSEPGPASPGGSGGPSSGSGAGRGSGGPGGRPGRPAGGGGEVAGEEGPERS